MPATNEVDGAMPRLSAPFTVRLVPLPLADTLPSATVRPAALNVAPAPSVMLPLAPFDEP